MGLETVEIVMGMEDHFRVRIPDVAAGKCFTVSDLQMVIVDLLVAQGRLRSDALEQEVWKGMMTVLAKEGFPTEDIRADSKWIGDITKYG